MYSIAILPDISSAAWCIVLLPEENQSLPEPTDNMEHAPAVSMAENTLPEPTRGKMSLVNYHTLGI